MSQFIKSLVAIFAGLILSASAVFASADKRVALVIGNQNYQSTTPLKNPLNDAAAISAELERLGFDVITGTDLTYDGLRDTVRNFTREARAADVTLFYYAGHGIAVDGENYIVPVDAKLNDPFDWEFEVYNVGEILRLIDRSPGPSLVFLDACRDNPLADILAQAQGMSSRSLNSRGIMRVATENLGTTGTVIAYATEPGQVAADGSGDNSPFAVALLDHLGTANTDFASITSLITRDVMEMTNGQQRPRFDVSLTGPLMLNEVAEPVVAPEQKLASLDEAIPATPQAPSTGSAQIQQLMFEAAMKSNDIADFETFVAAFPNSPFTPMAQNAINRLSAEAPPARQEVVASLNTAAPVQPSLTRLAMAPLQLTATPAAVSIVSSQATENALALDRSRRKELQLRLNLAGHNVGTPDGALGPNSRKGIRSWQAASGFSASGYLNAVQHQFLVAATDQTFTAHMVSNPNALTAPVKKVSSGKSSKPSSKSNSNPLNSDFMKGVLTGAGIGIILGK